MENMTESPSTEEAAPMQNKTKRLHLAPGKSIKNLEVPKSDLDDSEDDFEDSTSSSNDGSTTDEDLPAVEDVIDINNINVGDFVVPELE